MKISHLSLALLLLVFMGAGCSSSSSSTMPPAAPAMNNAMQNNPQESLQSQLERVYADTRALTNDPTPDRYLAAIDLTGADPENAAEIRDGWQNREQMLKIVVPDLKGSDVKFIQLVEEGDWAGYYYVLKVNDQMSLLKLQRFHKVNGMWKMATGALVRQPGTAFTNFDAEKMKQEIQASNIMQVKP